MRRNGGRLHEVAGLERHDAAGPLHMGGTPTFLVLPSW
jgi:hypothetical protein